MSEIRTIRLWKPEKSRRREGVNEEEITFLCAMTAPEKRSGEKGEEPAVVLPERAEGESHDPLQD